MDKCFVLKVKMNEIVNKFLLAVKEPGFTDSACGPFTKNKQTIEKFMQNWKYRFYL